MVFIVTQIKSRAKELKPWCGISIDPEKTLQNFFNEFASGSLQQSNDAEPIPDKFNTARITCYVGKSKDDVSIPVDVVSTIGEVTSVLGSFLKFDVEPIIEELDEPCSSKKDAFHTLMMTSRDKNNLPEKKNEDNNKKHRLWNMVLDMLRENNVGWSLQEKQFLGIQFFNTVTDVLWDIDGNHDTLSSRGCGVPMIFKPFTGFNCPEKRKKRKIDSDYLTEVMVNTHSSSLAKLSGMAYLQTSRWTNIRDSISSLSNNLRNYGEYLKRQKEKVSLNREKLIFVLSEREIWGILSETKSFTEEQEQTYGNLKDALMRSEYFEVIFLEEFKPSVKWKKHRFLQNLVVPCKTVRYTYTSSTGNLDFAWRVPTSFDDTSLLARNMKIVDDLRKEVPTYHSRAMKRTFVQSFGTVVNCKPMFLRKAYSMLTGDSSAARTTDEMEIDKRVTEMVELQDPELIVDLRCNNEGQPERYDVFLAECQKYVNEKVETSVDDRRHDPIDRTGDVIVHLAAALSVPDLHNQVTKRCPEGTPIPSISWLRLQFWPRRCNSKVGERYRGRIKVKFMVQSRQFRQDHIDMHYASALFRYLKEFAFKYKDDTTFVCMDDKHTMKIGEPGYPLAAVERGKQVLVARGSKFLVGDHDFSKFSMIPSVTLNINIPDKVDDSWYSGKVHVLLKEHSFQPSSAIRHITELHRILEFDHHPNLAIYTDGGPDHRTNLMSVQLALICLFLNEDRDIVIAVRTPPYNSWKDPAERVMSTLNLAAQGVGLMRQSTDIEGILSSCDGLKDIRVADEENPGLDVKKKVIESVYPCKELLKDVIERCTFSKEALTVLDASTDDEIDQMWSEMKKVDESVSRDDKSKVKIEKKEEFQVFYKNHCLNRHYFFSVKKCKDSNCKFHSMPRGEDFDSVHHLPDPVPNGERYKPFEEVYGTVTTEEYRPSISNKAKVDKRIPFNPSGQTALNVRQVITCSECSKPRVLHSSRKVKDNVKEISEELDSLSYSCGASLQDAMDACFLENIYVRADLTCSMPIEVPYFSAGYDSICYYCGTKTDLEIKEQFHPICISCKKAKKPVKSRKRKTPQV